MFRNRTFLIFVILVALGIIGYFVYQSYFSESGDTAVSKSGKVQNEGNFLLTIVLKPQNGKSLDEIQKKLNETGFYKKFPPAGTEIQSWNIAMGMGQIITMKVTPSKIREVNIAIEKLTWGAYTSEIYTSYDFMPIYKASLDTTSTDSTRVTIQE